ncbi:MAG: hypothetical protein HYS55_06200 [Candidatus Omnitrophica bacterium]|nr:hypothetical protein [Candidatus Omnitrophota bacterium]
MINFRFLSYVLSEAHLYAAVRYVELNPVKAKMVQAAEDYGEPTWLLKIKLKIC